MVAYIIMNFKRYKHIIFDFDQTLATLLMDWSSWQPGVVSVIKKFEPDFDENTDLHMYDIHRFINQYGPAFRDDYVDFEVAMEKATYHGYQLITPTFNLLQTCHQQNKKLYLLTSNSKEIVLPILKELQITNYFTNIITLEDVANVKPDPMAFSLIVQAEAEINKSQYLMIGDSISDKEFARNAGIDYFDITQV